MKHSFLSLVLIFSISCSKTTEQSIEIRDSFNKEEQYILETAKKIITQSYFATFITINKNGQSKARVMEPFAPDENFIFWLATKPKRFIVF